MKHTIRPLGNRVIVEQCKQEKKTAGGIILPDAVQENTQLAIVRWVALGTLQPDGRTIPVSVQPGQTVIFAKYSGVDMGNDMLLLSEDEILGVVET